MCQIGFKEKIKQLETLFFTGSISVHKNDALFFNRSRVFECIQNVCQDRGDQYD